MTERADDLRALRNLRAAYGTAAAAVGFWLQLTGKDLIEEYGTLLTELEAAQKIVAALAYFAPAYENTVVPFAEAHQMALEWLSETGCDLSPNGMRDALDKWAGESDDRRTTLARIARIATEGWTGLLGERLHRDEEDDSHG